MVYGIFKYTFKKSLDLLDNMKNFSRKRYSFFLILPSLLIVLTCGVDEHTSKDWSNISRSNSYSGNGPAVFHVDTTGNVNLTYSLKIGNTPKSVYFIFTNTTMGDAESYPTVQNIDRKESATSNAGSSKNFERNEIETPDPAHNFPVSGTPFISEFNEKALQGCIVRKGEKGPKQYNSILGKTMAYEVGSENDFYLHSEYTQETDTINALCQAKVENVHSKSLYVWVDKNVFRENYVNQGMIDGIAEKFLREGEDNDVYEWVSAIFGNEWGPHNYNGLIAPDNSIHILIAEIVDSQNHNNSIIGYFWNKDNFENTVVYNGKEHPSNRKVMFYLNSNFVKKDMTTIYSTLAHELQHMIHFYQKIQYSYPFGKISETWLNEMCSVVAEDFVASKLGIEGPRGVAGTEPTAGAQGNKDGILPTYNLYNYESVINWYDTYPQVLRNYSITYAFGAYLARNFGGASFYQKLLQNKYTDYQAIEFALKECGIQENFSSVMRKWGAANLLSHLTEPPPGYYQYNSGNWFTSYIGSLKYEIGSINLNNYVNGPKIYTTMPTGKQAKASNLYYKVGEGLTGTLIHKIKMENKVQLTVVIQ